MAEPPRKPDPERLLGSFEEFEADVPAPSPKPRVQRTPTVKEKIVLPPAPANAATLPPAPLPKPKPSEPPAEPDTPSFRPKRRPPVALLCVVDDGREEGEWVRLRADATVIGRAQGDVVIPHDDLMSSKHAAIRRVTDEGKFRWELMDLGSTNGTFVKVHKVALKPGQELQVGHSRFRFEGPQPPAATPALPDVGPKGTVSWHSVDLGGAFPVLVEVTPRGDGRRFVLSQPENWIGRDSGCTIALVDDPVVAPKHARAVRDAAGHWHLESVSGRDGVWLRVERTAIDKTCSFQLGEQRFVLRVP